MSRTPKKPTKNPSAELPVQPPQQRSLADEAEGTAGREMAGWDDPSSDFGSDDSDEELPLSEDEAAEDLEGDSHAPDDALGLYLRQMGAIPLLDRARSWPWPSVWKTNAAAIGWPL